MSTSNLPAGKPSTDRLLECLADTTRRETLAALRGRSDPVGVDELATAVVAGLDGTSSADVTLRDPESVVVELVHAHLPALADASLVEWDGGDDAVSATDHAAFDDPLFRRILAADADDWDAVLRALADARRRHALAVLEAAESEVDLETLARRVVSYRDDVAASEVPGSETDDVAASLYHSHLPTLRRAGLVSVDGDSVAYYGHPELDGEWLSAALGDRDGTDRGTADTHGSRRLDDGVADGRPRTLIDEADD